MLKNLTLLAFVSLLISAPAVSSAGEGFLCKSMDEDLAILIALQPRAGESSPMRADSMVVANPNVQKNRQMIARFNEKDGLLSNAGPVFVGYVDPRHPDTGRKGERIAGTTLGQIKSILVEVDFEAGLRLRPGSQVSARVVYSKRNGETLQQDFACVFRATR